MAFKVALRRHEVGPSGGRREPGGGGGGRGELGPRASKTGKAHPKRSRQRTCRRAREDFWPI